MQQNPFQFQRLFNNENEAKEAAQITILEILSNPSNLDDDKFTSLSLQYQNSSLELDKSIATTIQTQIEAINHSRNYIDLSFANLQKCEKQIEELNLEYEKDAAFHKELLKYEKLSTYRKNIGLMLDQMKYIFSIKEQIEKMNQIFESGQDNLENLHYKLIALTDIRDEVLDAMNSGSHSKQDLQVILQEFSCLSEFETKFYDYIFGKLKQTLQLSIEKPQQLIKILQIVESGDKARTQRKKEAIFKDRAIKAIMTGIDDKFNKILDSQKEAIMVLENSKFTSGDLILVLDHTVRCFPSHYSIFKVFEDCYRMNIEQRILPFLEDEGKVAESFGTLINLLSWVDSYENLLARVGEKNESYVYLRSKVKGYMPVFLDHVSNLIIEYSENAIQKDKQEQQTEQNIMRLIKSKQDLVTYFPEDLFHFINQQFDILGPKLKGEIIIEFIRSLCSTLQEILKRECKNFVNDLPVSEQGSELSPIFQLVLYINNYYKCMTHSHETKQYSLRFVDSTQHERVEQIIYQDLTMSLNESIGLLLDHAVKMVSYEVNNQIVPELFTPKWLNEDFVTQALTTIKDYLQDLQLLMMNQIYFSKLVKLVYKNFINCYIEQLIATMHYLYPAIAKNFFPKKLTNLSLFQEDKEKKKKEKERKAGILMIMSNKELIVPQIQQDRDIILRQAEQDYLAQIGKTQLQSMETTLNCLINCLTKSKMELEGMLNQVAVCFEDNSLYILEVVLQLRDDCASSKNKIELLQKIIAKRGI